MSDANSFWVFVERRGDEIEEESLAVASAARKLADEVAGEVCAVVLGSGIGSLADSLSQFGLDRVYWLDGPLLAAYSGELYTDALANLISEKPPHVFLCAATATGTDLASRLAARLKTGLVSDCVALGTSNEGLLLLTKPIHDGKVYCTMTCPWARPQMATVRPGTFDVKRQRGARKPQVTVVTPQLRRKQPRTTVEGVVKAAPEAMALDEADVIVAVGRGAGGRENLPLFEGLARRLGGSIGASLVPVDEGWIDKKRLVGQTGLTVSPRLYIACGISGASHHTLGMKDSKLIVAINKDRHAPISQTADVVVIGDVLKVVPAITRRLDELGHPTPGTGNV